MPELPDLDVLADALHAALTGRVLIGSTVAQPLVLRGTRRELAALESRSLERVSQRGKFLVLEFGRDRIIINPMLTGRLGLAGPADRARSSTAVTLTLGPRSSPRDPVAGWTAGAAWVPADDEPVQLRYSDPTRMGKIYLLPSGMPRPVAGWDEQGPDVDDPALDLAAWRTRIARHSGELKGLLKNQLFIAGIGNGYADEILWVARLAPSRRRSSLAPEEIDRLHAATRAVVDWAIARLRTLVPPRFDVEQRDFLQVHRKGGQPCPRCGATISEVSPGGFVTSWCRACQV